MKNFRFYKAIKEHVQWLESNKKYGRQLVLENEDLSFLSIVDTNLSESIFKNCNLQRAVFKNVSFDMAYLYKNNFSYTNILNSTLYNSVFKKNIFEGASFKDLDCVQTQFLNNNFNRVTFNNIKYSNSYFESNSFVKSDFNSISFINVEVVKDRYNYCDFANISYLDNYMKSSIIQNSYFYDCTLKNSYIHLEETNNIYFKTEPKYFFTNYKNKYTRLYMDRLFDTLHDRFHKFETVFSNYKYTSDNDNEFVQLYKELINDHILADQIKYQVQLLENEGEVYSEQLKLIKEKALYIEPLMENRMNILSSLVKSGGEDE